MRTINWLKGLYPTASDCSRSDRHGQSEVVGVVLLTAVVVLFVGMFGTFYLGSVNDRADQGPLVDAEFTATDDRLEVTHTGGDSVPIEELFVTVQRGSTTERHSLEAFDVVADRTDGDDHLDPGERLASGHGLGTGALDVRLIHEPSNTVLRHAHLDAATATPTA